MVDVLERKGNGEGRRVEENEPWLDEMRSEEDDAEDNAQASNNNVGDAKEVVAPTHNGASGDDDGLFASVFGCGEDYHFIISTKFAP